MKCKGVKMQNKYLFLVILFAINLFAVDGKMRVYFQSNTNIYTSQKVIVGVDLMTTAYSISDQRITFPTTANYIVTAPNSAAYIRTEEIKGTDWQMIHYEYEVYALQAGKIKLSAVKATFSASMGYGQPKKAFHLKSGALHFNVRTPKGIPKEKFVLVTSSYSISQKVSPKKAELYVGDAIEVEIVQKAHRIPDILLSQIHYKSTSLIRVYEKEPLLKNGIKGEFDVSRTDKFTFVATAEGNVSIPEQRFIWWDFRTKKVHTERIPAITFKIIADPQIALDAKQTADKKRLLYAGAALLVLLLLGRVLLPKIHRYNVKKKALYMKSEKGLFDKVLASKDNVALYENFYLWLEKIDVTLARNGFKGIALLQPSFSELLISLENVLVNQEKNFDKISFIHEATKLRILLLKKQKQSPLAVTLNP